MNFADCGLLNLNPAPLPCRRQNVKSRERESASHGAGTKKHGLRLFRATHPTNIMRTSEYVAITAAGALVSQMTANIAASEGTRRHSPSMMDKTRQMSSGSKAPASSSAKSLR